MMATIPLIPIEAVQLREALKIQEARKSNTMR